MDNFNSQSEERTLKDLSPNTASLLCYVAGWISGIIFLVLEQKNRTIRFHALQSIIVFGILAVAIAIFGVVPVIGSGFAAALGLLAFILWIILMVKAGSGEYFKMPWVGNLADRLASDSLNQSPRPEAPKADVTAESAQSYSAAPTPPAAYAAEPVTLRQSAPVNERQSRAAAFKTKYYSGGARAGRIVGSSFAIAWSVVLLIFFNFFNQYIAYYVPLHDGANSWQVNTLITDNFSLWLPILTTTLVLTIIGHVLLIVFDKFILRKIVKIILDAFGAATAITLLVIFPFDFSVIPSHIAADGVSFGITVALVLTAIGFIIGAIVKFIQLIVHLVEGKY